MYSEVWLLRLRKIVCVVCGGVGGRCGRGFCLSMVIKDNGEYTENGES